MRWRVGAASGEQECREDDAPTDQFHGNGVMDGVTVAGTGEDVTMNVDVGVKVRVGVEKSGVFVDVETGVFVTATVDVLVGGSGVIVETFGTQSSCPAKMVVEAPMQLPACSCGYVMP